MFLHLPKAAGTSVFTLLQDVLRPRYVGYYLDRTQFGGFDKFESLSKEVRAGVQLVPRETLLDLAAGHLARSTLLSLSGSAGGKLMTVLREPRSRLLSHWLYWRSYEDARLAVYGEWGWRIALSRQKLIDFAGHPEISCVTDNPLVRMLLWPHALVPETGFIKVKHDETLLREAILRLSEFDFLGSVENPQLLQRLSAWLDSTYQPSVRIRTVRRLSARLHGGNGANVRNEQVLPGGLSKCQLHKELADAEAVVHERTRLDQSLWEYVRDAYVSTASRLSSDAAFANTVTRYVSMASGHVK